MAARPHVAVANLSLARAVWPGRETLFPPVYPYRGVLLTIAGVSFALIEWLAHGFTVPSAGLVADP